MRVRTAVDLGLVLRERRKKLGLRQQVLADRVGVSRQWIIAVEKGKARAEIGLLLRALEVLGLEVDVGGPPKVQAEDSPFVTEADLDAVLARAREVPE